MEEKIDNRKKYYLVLDVETTGGLGNPLIYDLGFAICDKKGNIYEKRSFIIKEIFDNKRLMDTAYYKEKSVIFGSKRRINKGYGKIWFKYHLCI